MTQPEMEKKTIEIPEGYEARIEDNKVILEPKESEDNRIRKFLVGYFECIKSTLNDGIWKGFQIDDILTYIEKQDKSKPAWSEEDERHKNTIIRAIHNAVNITPIQGELAEEWLKSKIIKWYETE